MDERERQVWSEIRHLAVELGSKELRDRIRAEARRDEESFAYLFDAIRRLVECCEGAGRLSWEGDGLIARLTAIEGRLEDIDARLERIEARLAPIQERLEEIKGLLVLRLQAIEERLARLEEG